ncbi:hypothetical protein ACFFK0_06535 [Paenibacillus chartarius]|uniref:Uncharacterized protein n=1 Tax=Paenibacillus chartarius TaxID=747481 RepID=A0ABV6DHI9_9BACL
MDEQQKYVSLVLKFLSDEVVEAEEYGSDSVTLNLKDVNFEIDGVEWEQAIQEHLKENGYNDVSFQYGDGNWVTIYKKYTNGG